MDPKSNLINLHLSPIQKSSHSQYYIYTHQNPHETQSRQHRLSRTQQEYKIHDVGNEYVCRKILLFVVLFSLISIVGLTVIYSYYHANKYEHEHDFQNKIQEKHNRIESYAQSLLADSERKCPPGTRLWKDTCVRRLYYPDPLDISMVDNKTDPCDSMYNHACGMFIQDSKNLGRHATFDHLKESSNERVSNIIKTAHKNTNLGKFYDACVSHERESEKEIVHAVKSRLGLTGEIIRLIDEATSFSVLTYILLYGGLAPFGVNVELHPLHALEQPVLCVYAINDMPLESAEEISQRIHIIYGEQSDEYAQGILDIHKLLYENYARFAVHGREDLFDYAYMSQEFEQEDYTEYSVVREMMLPVFDLNAFLKNVGVSTPPEMIWVHKQEYFRELVKIMQSIEFRRWKAYFYHAILFYVFTPTPHANEVVYMLFHKSYNPVHPLPWTRPRQFSVQQILNNPAPDERCVQITHAYMPDVINEIFVSEIITPKSKEMIKEVSENVRNALVLRTKSEKMREKLQSVKIVVGNPENPNSSDFGNELDIGRLHSDNIFKIRMYHKRRNLRMLLSESISLSDVLSGLAIVPNAMYYNQLNSLVINAALLQPPVFSELYDTVSIYSRLGVIVGHELVHSIDNNGQKFNNLGKMKHWLPTSETLQYEENSLCFMTLYTGNTKRYGTPCHGMSSLNENIADTEGFWAAYNALFSSEDTNDKDIQDAMQQFFLSYAQLWCDALSEEEEKQLAANSVHSIPEFRVDKVVESHAEYSRLWKCASTRNKKCSVLNNAK